MSEQRAELGIDGNAGFSLLGSNLQEGEAEFVAVERRRDELMSVAERRAAHQAHKKLEARLGRAIPYFFGRSHPFGD